MPRPPPLAADGAKENGGRGLLVLACQSGSPSRRAWMGPQKITLTAFTSMALHRSDAAKLDLSRLLPSFITPADKIITPTQSASEASLALRVGIDHLPCRGNTCPARRCLPLSLKNVAHGQAEVGQEITAAQGFRFAEDDNLVSAAADGDRAGSRIGNPNDALVPDDGVFDLCLFALLSSSPLKPSLKRGPVLAGFFAEQQTLHPDVLVQVRPMQPVAGAADLEVGPLPGRPVPHKRGYQPIGTETLRPSSRSTASVSSLTVARRILGNAGIVVAESVPLIP